MERLSIAKDHRHFVLGGKPFFWQADTVWAAFTNITDREWEDYLSLRQRQGFNVLQINVLPQWDRSLPDLGLEPFERGADGTYRFDKLCGEYFDHAERMLDKLRNHGFIPALVPLWVNYVPDTWASREDTSAVIPAEYLDRYYEVIITRFQKFAPVYLCSGDSRFETEQEIRSYQKLMKKIKELDPCALTTLHPGGGYLEPPEVLLSDPNLDFYMVQSSHGRDQSPCYTLPGFYRNLPFTKPIVNGEPCYEGHGYGHSYGRFSAFDVRKASWQSVLSGANAGITYGAHGVWGWHKEDSEFKSEEFSSLPFVWKDALRFKGAYDVTKLREICEAYHIYEAEPVSVQETKNPEICSMKHAGSGRIFFYLPCATRLTINGSYEGYRACAILLENGRFEYPKIRLAGGTTVLELVQENSDMLVILEKL